MQKNKIFLCLVFFILVFGFFSTPTNSSTTKTLISLRLTRIKVDSPLSQSCSNIDISRANTWQRDYGNYWGEYSTDSGYSSVQGFSSWFVETITNSATPDTTFSSGTSSPYVYANNRIVQIGLLFSYKINLGFGCNIPQNYYIYFGWQVPYSGANYNNAVINTAGGTIEVSYQATFS